MNAVGISGLVILWEFVIRVGHSKILVACSAAERRSSGTSVNQIEVR
ncbi:MAG: hypothetical protein ACLPYZ_09480 [Limisphaerales bacterium]